MSSLIDHFNQKILGILQRDSTISQREIAEQVHLSPNACWNRLQNLKKEGVILGQTVRLDREKLGLGLVVFVMIKTRHHSGDWLQMFRQHVADIPEVVDFFRIGGEYDYLLKVVTKDMTTYDGVYQRLIKGVELDSVTSNFAMESIVEQRPLPV
ncbi:MAG: Lrp/AsnC family transcriptional regulator [Hyphomicrobiales bacterium]|nr:Lrp/AsnC family transcriptional regulator [Hyphomicrobiales bacterium]